MMIPWVLGADSEHALRDFAHRLLQHADDVNIDPQDAGYTLATRQAPHAHRAVLLAQGGDFTEPLHAVAQGRPSTRAIEGVAAAEAHPVFIFPGQGTVFAGMGAGLLDAAPVFARRMEQCAEALEPHVDWSLIDVLRAEDVGATLRRPDVVEPVLFAVMVSLADLWQAHGVTPQAVLGFSIGEIAAACVAGALDLDEAARVAVLWSRAHVPLVGHGAMAMVGLPVDEVTARLADPGTIDIAGIIAPRSVVIAGDAAAIADTVERLRDEGAYAQQLSVDFPAHSPRVDGQRESMVADLGTVAARSATLPFYSSVTGGRLDTSELDAEYWFRNLRSPIRFEQAARAVLADGHQALIELSAHPVLVTAMREIVSDVGAGVPVVGSLRRDQQGTSRFLTSMAEAYVHGVVVDWSAAFDGPRDAVELPMPAEGESADPMAPRDGAATPAVREDGGLVDAVFAHIINELGMSAGDKVGGAALDPTQRTASLFDLGFDSVQLVKLQTRLEHRLNVRLESTCIIDHPEMGALVGEIRRTIQPHEVTRPASAPLTVASPVSPSEPVAVIGMSFRLPGQIRTREQLWTTLSEQTDVVGEIPAGRWSHSPLDIAEVTTTQGGYLHDVDLFDPIFFNISPSEAEQIDPQQRLLLELTWEAFEDAGIDPFVAGEQGRVGTFVGIYNNDYRQVGNNLGYPHEAYSYTGNMANAAAGRISYTYGFRGPSIAIDTACSSSLYALHLGSRELKHGGCDLVVAAGVNLILSPEGHLSWSRLGALSPTGRCRSFDDGADGYIRSEGGGVVILKRLADAERDGDSILAVLSGSAVSHNGRSGGFTVPSGRAQSHVIEDAMAEAGLGIDDISYVEAHGSGTPIGDPQEINALARVFAGRTTKVRVGSVKSNLGHLESAAGMAGLCKVLVSLEHGRLPATLHFRAGNHLIDWDAAPVEVVAEEIPWEPTNGRRRAGISSFGISGTNAHVIVEEYQPPAPVPAPESKPALTGLLPVSANSEAALQAALQNLAAWSVDRTVDLDDLAHTLARRPSLRYRAALVCNTVGEIPTAVEAALGGDDVTAAPTAAPAPVFVFSGQGTQYPGMARELYDHAELFRRELDAVADQFRLVGGIDVLDVMFGDDTEVFESPLYTQSMIFAVELALARYWEALGITPAAVIGHSIGEYAAACVAGVMSRDQAVDLVLRRARIMDATPRNGSMATLLCSRERAEELLESHPDVSVAAVNAAENVTISGLAGGIEAVAAAARKRRIFVERLDVSHPFHSAQMVAGAEQLYEQIATLDFDAPTVPWISAQTGRAVTPESMIDAAYWSRHLVEPVLFRDAVGAARDRGLHVFVEIGAMATLGGLIAQEFPHDALVVPTLRKGRSDIVQLLEGAGRLWMLGAALQWHHLPGEGGNLLRDVPRTPFDRQRIWYRDRTREADAPMIPSADDITRADTRRTAERAAVSGFVKQVLSEVTGVAVETLDDSIQMFSLGVDSLMLVQLGKRLDKEYSLDIPLKAFFESLNTPGQVTDYILENRPAAAVSATEAAAAAVSATEAPAPAPPPAADAVAPGAVPALVDRAGEPAASSLEEVIRSQLALMEQQLQMLSGSAPVALPPPPPASPDKPNVGSAPRRGGSAPAPRKVGTYTNNIELEDDALTAEQSRFIREFVAKYTAKTRRSKEYADTHRETLADWIASLNFNPSLKETVYPVVSTRSRGASFWDVDGNEYLDTAMGYGVHFFGHQPEFVVNAMKAQLEDGYELGPQNRLAGEVADLIHEIVGSERVAFCNTGTEAVMVSVRLARAVSGRAKVARFTTSFHGAYDGVLAEADGTDSMPMSIGIPQSAIDDTIVLTYGSAEALDRIRRHGHELAAVLVEPVQSRNPTLQPTEFLRELRQICTEYGIALIFDEMVTGFRVDLRGAQSYFGVESDMSLYGKLVGGGMPIGIIAGKATYLDAVDGGAWSDVDDSKPAVPTTFFAGTFCKHPLTMAACKAVLEYVKESGAGQIAALNRFTDDFARRANDYFEAEGVPLKVAHFASLYRYETMVAQDMGNLALTLNLFFKLLQYHGVYVWERRTAFFSLAHTTEHQDRILDAIATSVQALRAGGFDFRRATSTGSTPGQAGSTGAARPESYAPTAVSSPEQRVYVLSHLRGGNEAYQVLAGLRCDGPLDQDAVTAAFAAIAQKHPKLRSVYEIDGTDIKTRVLPEVTAEFHLFDRTQDPALTSEDVLAVLNAPMDLAAAPLWRYGIVVDEDGTQHLVMAFHHIIVDGTALEIILDDLAHYLEHGRLSDDDESQDYASFVRLQSELSAGSDYAAHRQWWLSQFESIPPPLNLPTDSPYPVVNDFAGGRYYFQIDPDLHDAATKVMAQHKTTPSVFYLTLVSVLLAKLSGEDDLCIGVPMDQRMFGPFEKTVGMFAESLPLRIRPASGTRVSDLLREVRDTSLAAMEHAHYPYAELIQELDLERDNSRNALFDVMFIYTNARGRTQRFGDVTGTPDEFGARGSMFGLTVELTERDGGLFADVNYSSVYSQRRIAELGEHFGTLLARVVRDIDRTVGELGLLDDSTRNRLMEQGTGPVVADIPNLTDLFGEAFKKHAQQPAIRFRGADLTYEEVALRVDGYAAHLQAQGAGFGDVIGLALPSSPELIMMMLAVNRIGATWLPMDIKNPPARLRYTIETADPAKVICSEDLAASLDLGDRKLIIDEVDLRGDPPPTVVPAEPDDLAYVIFTSGSTGRPKGVMVTNEALANFLCGMPEALGWQQNKAVACLTTPSFDIYLLETLLTLAEGGTVVVAEDEDARTPASIAEFITGNGIDYLQMTPTRLRLLLTDPDAAAAALEPLEKLFVGGEAFPENLLAELRAHEGLQIFNVYGPTETCIWSSVKDLTTASAVSIGGPIANTTFYVLDDTMQMVPEGTAGNLWIGGVAVSPGYLNRPDLTDTPFQPNPFGPGRIYRAGDQAVWKNGELHCLGRTDNQVKVRGYRIELEEIELAIASHDGVAAAAANVDEIAPGNHVIRGYFQAKPGARVDQPALRDFVAQSLPDYMIPATFTEVADIPTTMSGKVDRTALASRHDQQADRAPAEKPSTIDTDLIAAWKKVLGNVTINYDDSFFDLGGNSLSVILLLEELDAAFPDVFDVSDLFANPTIRKLRSHLEGRLAERDAPSPDLGIEVPASWFAADGAADGRVETALSPRSRAALQRLRDSIAPEADSAIHAAFALTLSKVLGLDDVALGVVSGSVVTPVEISFAGTSQLAEIVADYRRQVDLPSVALQRFAPLRGDGGAVSIACCDTRHADETALLRHFDIVFAVTDGADPESVGIAYARSIDPAQAKHLLGGFVKVLGALGDSLAPAGEAGSSDGTSDADPHHLHTSKEKRHS